MKNPYYVAIASIGGLIALFGFYQSFSRLLLIVNGVIFLSETKNAINQTSDNLSLWKTSINVPIFNQIPVLNTIPAFIGDIAFSLIMLLIFIYALHFLLENL